MNTKVCESCGNAISPKAESCPKCGHPNPSAKKWGATEVIGVLFLAGIGVWYYFGGGAVESAQPVMQQAYNSVIDQSLNQYSIVKSSGDAAKTCIAAEGVQQAYLQAQDAANYKHWNDVAKVDCHAAGIDL